MANQTHLLRQFFGARPDQGTAPRTANLVRRTVCTLRNLLFLRINTLLQLTLPD